MENTHHPLIIYNDDTCSLRYVDEPHTVDALDISLRHFIGTQVGAICWSLGAGDIAYAWPSKVLDNYYDRLAEGTSALLFDHEKGFDSPITKRSPGEDPRNLMLTLHRQGIDYLPPLITKTRQAGLKFYGSFRMNDCHVKSDPSGILSSRFWREHQDYRLWEITESRSYYNAALDYSYAEVRQHRLDAIRECLAWYDMDGVELDFSRNPYTFQPSEAWEKRGLLTEFFREIRAIADEAGARRGKKVEVLIRAPFHPDKLRRAGMDVDAWLNERLIDKLILCNRWNDYNQSIEPWLSLCRDKGVAFYPSLEMEPIHNAAHNHTTNQSVGEIVKRHRALAQNFLAQGAEGVYLFNYPCLLFQVRRTPEEIRALTHVFFDLGKQETLLGKPMQYAFWQNLPVELESRRPAKYHQTIPFTVFNAGLASGSAQASISFHQATEANPHANAPEIAEATLPAGWVSYWLNGKEIPEARITREPQPAGRIASGFDLAPHEKITLTLLPSELKQGENFLGFYIPKFPEERDPVVQIYELLVDLAPSG